MALSGTHKVKFEQHPKQKTTNILIKILIWILLSYGSTENIPIIFRENYWNIPGGTELYSIPLLCVILRQIIFAEYSNAWWKI